jgi:hypothetical protein
MTLIHLATHARPKATLCGTPAQADSVFVTTPENRNILLAIVETCPACRAVHDASDYHRQERRT